MKILLAAVALLAALAAAPKPAPSPSPAPDDAWTMTTDRLDVNMKSGDFSAPGHVMMTRADGSTVDADTAKGNYKKKTALLTGNVKVHDMSGTFGLKSAKPSPGSTPRGPATLSTDQLQLDDTAHTYDATGHVHFTQADTVADAESAHLDDVAHLLTLDGHVHAVQGDRSMTAERASYNTVTGHGEADGNVTMLLPGFTPTFATPKPIVIKAPKIPR